MTRRRGIARNAKSSDGCGAAPRPSHARRRRAPSAFALVLACTAALAATSCGGRLPVPGALLDDWPQHQVDLIFADLGGTSVPEDAPREWDFKAPRNLRPCCAFGYDLGVRMGFLPVPGLRVGNLIEPDATGRHFYDPAPLSVETGGVFLAGEANGLVYTCRGGFIDVAHVRDYADWTVYLAGRIDALLDVGGVLELPDEGGRRYVYVVAPGAPLIERVGRRELAVTLAQWLAFRLSIWHEIATWYGWSSIEAFPEEASAFSPEDLYSNLIGIEIAGAIVRSGSLVTRRQYNHNMAQAIGVVLDRLGALPASGARAAADTVDGMWWDSSRTLPDKNLVLRRNFDLGPLMLPWTVPSSAAGYCREVAEPVALVVRGSIEGTPISDLVRLDVRIDPKVAARMSVARAHPWASQDDFASIASRARSEHESEQGQGADRPR